MGRIGEHAVVIGASMAGLLAGRVLSEAYDRVTVVERDALPPFGQGRRSVPQGRHAHVLLLSGQDALEELLPGFVGELVEEGAPTMQPLLDMRLTVAGHQLARVPVGPRAVLASRALFEGVVRRRVRALPDVDVLERCDALELVATGDRISAVRLRRRDGSGAEEVLEADLVVAATGRSDRVPGWLEALGYPRPAEERLAVDLSYVSRALRLRPGALDSDKLVGYTARPGCARGLSLLAQEGEDWLLTVSGYRGDRPPTEMEALLAFGAPLASPDVLAAIREAEPVGEVSTHRFPANQRRRYERLARFPEDLLVIGDAIASFNPVYGQGMSVAALEATELRRCLRDGGDELAARFFSGAARIVRQAWELSVGSDLALPEVAGRRSARVRVLNAYVRRVLVAAERDVGVSDAFARVLGLLEPPTLLLRPDIALRVVLGGEAGRRPGRTTRRVACRGPAGAGCTPAAGRVGAGRAGGHSAHPPSSEPRCGGPRVQSTVRRVAGDGVSLAVLDEGEGRAVLLLHGFPDSSHLWRHQIPVLVEAGMRAIAPDLRGFGESDKPQAVEAYGLDRSVADVVALLDGLGIERAHVVGHDWGAVLAWLLAAFEPARVERIVAMSVGHPNTLREPTIEQRQKAWYQLLFQFTGVAEALIMRDDWKLLRETLRGQRDLDRYLADLSRPGALTAGLNWYRANLAPHLELERRPPVPAVAAPTLGLWSSGDPYLTEGPMLRSADHVTGPWRYERIDGAGHWMQLDAPERIGELLVEFLG